MSNGIERNIDYQDIFPKDEDRERIEEIYDWLYQNRVNPRIEWVKNMGAWLFASHIRQKKFCSRNNPVTRNALRFLKKYPWLDIFDKAYMAYYPFEITLKEVKPEFEHTLMKAREEIIAKVHFWAGKLGDDYPNVTQDNLEEFM